MKKSDVKDAMRKNSIDDNADASNAIEFVEELLRSEIKDTKENYPYATRTIHELEVALSRVTSLYHDVNEIL